MKTVFLATILLFLSSNLFSMQQGEAASQASKEELALLCDIAKITLFPAGRIEAILSNGRGCIIADVQEGDPLITHSHQNRFNILNPSLYAALKEKAINKNKQLGRLSCCLF